ncbi:MAG TPA: hypothetical protein DCF33_19595 [Saprospirales bacterium]|nr:hypothetical protein [Saprospirales bacterium]
MEVLENAAEVCSKLSEWQKAYNFQKEWSDLHYEQLSGEKYEALLEVQKKYENEKLLAESAEKEMSIYKQRLWIVALVSILLFSLCLAVIFVNRSQRRRIILEKEILSLKQSFHGKNDSAEIFTIEVLKRKLPKATDLAIEDFEILRLIIESNGNLKNREMAERLNWTEPTVRYHKRKINRLFDLPNGTNLDILKKVLELYAGPDSY